MRFKETIIRWIAAAVCTCSIQFLNADVDVYEPGIVVDDEQMLLWMQDANYAMTSGHDEDGLMNWHDAKAWVEALDYGGYTDWRLPEMINAQAFNNSTSELSFLYTEYNISGKRYNDPKDYSGPFVNIPGKAGYYDSVGFWTGTDKESEPSDKAWSYSSLSIGIYENLHESESDKSTAEVYVWPVKAWTWGPYTVVEGGWVNTGDWLGWLWVREASWVYCWDLQQWMEIHRDTRDAAEGWLWVFQ